jgi:hypothetical protein
MNASGMKIFLIHAESLPVISFFQRTGRSSIPRNLLIMKHCGFSMDSLVNENEIVMFVQLSDYILQVELVIANSLIVKMLKAHNKSLF